REERRAARLQRGRAGTHEACGIRHVLDDLETRDDVERAGLGRRERLDVDRAIVDRQYPGGRVRARDGEILLGGIDAHDGGTAARERLAQDAAAAADVEHTRVVEWRTCGDVVDAQVVDLVQRAERA